MPTFDEDTLWFKGKGKRELKRHYNSIMPTIKEIALKSGYAIAVHGSMQRDLDLIAVPWVRRFVKPATLAERIHFGVTNLKFPKSEYRKFGFTEKPNGRIAIVLPIGTYAYIDLSVIKST